MTRITYYVQRYRPRYEAISKEISLLANHFSKFKNVRLHDLHLDGLFNLKFNKKINSFHFMYYPFIFWHTYLTGRRSHLNHIYTSLGDLPYLNVLNLKNTILTAAASCNLNKIKKRLNQLRKLKKIIVESEKQKSDLLSLGINPDKIKIIYPPVDLNEFNYEPCNEPDDEPDSKPSGKQYNWSNDKLTERKFKILYASCPTRVNDFKKRGIHLILGCASESKEGPIEFNLAWRDGAYKDIKRLINGKHLTNVKVENKIIADMNNNYAKNHCTIIPYTQYDDFLKLIPNSALESLAAGKPLLVSTKTEMAKIVQKEQCGVVFEPETRDLLRAIKELKNNYSHYQQHCRPTAAKYFSKEIFLRKYEELYNEL